MASLIGMPAATAPGPLVGALDTLALVVLKAVLDARNLRFYVWSRTAEPALGQ